jgi:hypothetical protein
MKQLYKSSSAVSKRRPTRMVSLLVAVLLVMSVGVAFAAYGLNGKYGATTTPELTNPANTSNPDDATDHITATNKDGVVDIKHELIDGDQKTFLGTIRVIGDYMYVYGYAYKSDSTPNTQSLSGWVLQNEDLGWGCVAIKKDKTTYDDPAGVIEGQPVTWMTSAYENCTKMTTKNGDEPFAVPKIPATVKHTDYMFSGCKSLTKISITTASTLSVNTFYHCSNLKQIFIGQNVKATSVNAFHSLPADCKFYYEGKTIPRVTENSGWRSVPKGIETDADIFIWALN